MDNSWDDPTGLSHPSPNHSARPRNLVPSLIILHATAGKTDAGDVSWCCDPKSKVSYHVIVGRDGTLYTLVPTMRQAWHAGKSSWNGREHCNAFSLGLAFANRHDQTESLTANQIHTARAILKIWLYQYPRVEAIVTHAEVAPGRKSDPNDILGFYLPDWRLDAFRTA